MSEAGARAVIKTAVESVTGYGVCYDYQRWAAEWPDFLSLFKIAVSGTDQIRGWTITAQATTQEDNQFGKGKLRTYVYKIRGYLGLDDSAATGKTMFALALAVVDALDASGLHNPTTYYHAGLAQLDTFEERMFGGVLCHYAEITQTVTEFVNLQ